MKIFGLFILIFISSCGNVKNGEIWQVNSREYVEIKGYSDSTYAKEKKKESSPFDQVNPVKFVLSSTIYLYQQVLSSQDGNSCQFRPSCSHYGVEAIKEHQLLGVLITADRLLRCNSYAYTSYHPIKGSVYISDPLDNYKKEKIDLEKK